MMNIERHFNCIIQGTLLRAGAILVFALCVTGCDTNREASQQAPAAGPEITRSRAPATQVSAQAPDAAPHAADIGDLEHGTFRITMDASGVSILANGVDERKILDALAERAGFKVADMGTDWKVASLVINTPDVHTALVELLKQYRYQIIYEFDTERQADTLRRVVVMNPHSTRIARAQDGEAGTGRGRPANASKPSRRVQVIEAPSSMDQQVYLNQLLDPSADRRVEAAENIEPSGDALDYLANMLVSDPAPQVRAAVAETLGDSEDPRAVDALLTGLNDADASVLVEVIDALGFVGNRQTINQLLPFLQHPDEDVRDAADSSIELLE